MTTFSKFNFDKTLESQYLHFISKRKISFVKLLAFTHLKEENVKTVIKLQTINKGKTKTILFFICFYKGNKKDGD